jgi:phosphoglycerate dehydrogenase-like enzyme
MVQGIRVHWLGDPSPEQLEQLRAQLDGSVDLTSGRSTLEGSSFEILISGRPQAADLESSPHLRAVIVPWAGIPQETGLLLKRFPHIALHNLHHNAAATAETAVALLLAAAKLVVPMDQALRRGDWSSRYEQPSPALLLAGKTALILGYGAIGRHIGRACLAMGMTVMATKRNTEETRESPVELYPPHRLHQLLPRTHVLIISLPLTPETESLIGKEELELLMPGSILVNIGRGAIVDEQALYAALAGGRLHSAGLDVWYNYPQDEAARRATMPSQLPYHQLDNVVLSPHRGGGAREIEALRMAALAKLLNAAARGEAMPNRVDREAGY